MHSTLLGIATLDNMSSVSAFINCTTLDSVILNSDTLDTTTLDSNALDKTTYSWINIYYLWINYLI